MLITILLVFFYNFTINFPSVKKLSEEKKQSVKYSTNLHGLLNDKWIGTLMSNYYIRNILTGKIK